MAQHGRILDWAGESQYYVEPKRLAKLGYLTARAEPGKTRPRTVYTLTDKGLEALGAWARTAVRFTPVKSELLLRLLIADLVGEEVTRESVTTIRDDISDLFVRLEESEEFARTRPSRTKYLLLVFGFLRRLLDLHLEFVDDLERELAPRTEPTPGGELAPLPSRTCLGPSRGMPLTADCLDIARFVLYYAMHGSW
jgi:DNA-binding PadR family transcriptional regulator